MIRGGSERPISKKEATILACLLVVTVGVASLLLWIDHRQTIHNPFPAAARKGLTFPLYYPTRLPTGYSVKPGSFQQKSGALIFYISAPNHNDIGVSEQSMPTGVTLPESSNGPVKIPGEVDFQSPIGHSHIGLEGAHYVSETITSGGTWIIINLDGFTPAEATAITQSFVSIR